MHNSDNQQANEGIEFVEVDLNGKYKSAEKSLKNKVGSDFFKN